MRDSFAAEASNLAEKDPRFILLTGDIGNRLFNTYKEKYAERFLNCGVAEANMTGVAAGMAMAGLRPMTYTITSFNTARCYEQIRVDLCYHNLPVTVVGVGGGLSYSELGYTHHAVEDIGMMRLLPNMSIFCPGDAMEVKAAMRAALLHDGPVYIRLGKKGEYVAHADIPLYKVGGSLTVKDGKQVCLLAVGNMLSSALKTAELLETNGISTRVVSFYSIKPFDENLLFDVFSSCEIVSVLEEHSQIGGVATVVSEWLVQNLGHKARFLPFSLPDKINHKIARQTLARKRVGLAPEDVSRGILQVLRLL